MTDDQNAQQEDRSAEGRGPVIVPFTGAIVKPAVAAEDPAEAAAVSLRRSAGSVEPSPAPGPESFRSARGARQRVLAGRAALSGGPFSGEEASTVEDASSGADVLSDTIRRWARPTTVDELKSRGVRKVRSISMSRVGALLEKAVNRALIERTLESDSDEALSLSTTARKQFLRLSREEGNEDAASDGAALGTDRPLHERATSTLDRLRRELEERREQLANREKQVSEGELDQAEDARLSDQLRELFAIHAGVDDRALESEVLSLVAGELRTSRRRARLARLEEHQREIGTLERRITKLSTLLGETEDTLRRVRAGKKGDLGVSSIYDEVQGLGEGDAQYEQKSELMRSLFEANLALRKG